MSVLFALIQEDFIALAADTQATNITTLKPEPGEIHKIYQWSPYVAASGGGNYFLYKTIINSMYEAIHLAGTEYILEDLGELAVEAYKLVRENYDFVTDEDYAKIAFAGTLSNNQLGIITVEIDGPNTSVNTFDISEQPVVIVRPEDLSKEETFELFKKATHDTVNDDYYKNLAHIDMVTKSLRKAVRYVSEHSKYVGRKSDYLVIKPQPKD